MHLLVPVDYIYTNASNLSLRQLQRESGRRTSLAIKLPVVYSSSVSNVNTYQVKMSAYGPLGMGTVNHFSADGLQRRFVLRYDPENIGPFIDEEHGIVGELRRYERNGERVVELDRRVVGRDYYALAERTCPQYTFDVSQLHVG